MNTTVSQAIKPKFSYFWLRLKEYLNESYPELANDQDFLDARSDLAAQTYVDHIGYGDNHVEAEHYANEVLFANLPFSKMDLVYEVIDREFERYLKDNEDIDQREFALEMLPICKPIFEKYDIERREFEYTRDYEWLYTELTGTIQIWLEENGKVEPLNAK